MKRFTDADKWSDPWFRKLGWQAKLAYFYLLDNCDAAGVWEPDYDLANFQVGQMLDWPQCIEELGDRLERIKSGRVRIVKFLRFQYGKLSRECRPHDKIFEALARHCLDPDTIDSLMPRVSHTLQEEEEEEEKKRKRKRQGKSAIPDAEWLESLGIDPANAGVDVRAQADKCRFWCSNNNRQFTRRTFVNWLLRADRAIKSHGTHADQRPNSRRLECAPDYSGVKSHNVGS